MLSAILCLLLLSGSARRDSSYAHAFTPARVGSPSVKSVRLGATVTPSSETVVGTIGNGYLPTLVAKVAAHRQHGKSWILCPSAEIEVMQELVAMDGNTMLPNLELVPASDTDRVEELLGESDALLFGTDDVESVVAPAIIDYMLDPEKISNKLKRVVVMSRNLSGKGMGFFASASRTAANAQVWDNSAKSSFQDFEENLRRGAGRCGADLTIVRSGTLKGGASGEDMKYPQYLSEKFYELTKADIVTWQLLFDCNVRGVKLAKGDVMPGPGVKAVFAATGVDEHEGDSSRCGVAEAMVRCLEYEMTSGEDFGVATVASREIPTEEEWNNLFSSL